MKIIKFEDIIAWQKAQELYINSSEFVASYNLSLEISKLLSGFIKVLTTTL